MLEKEKIEYLENRIRAFPCFPLSLLPTPCHKLDRLSKDLGLEIYCKRDDLTGFGLGGNKTRKLELLVGEALEQGCDTLVTCGGVQSNFCRLTAAAGVAAGMQVHLVLGGGRPEKETGNLILDRLVGADIHHVSSSRWDDWEAESDALVEELESKGRKVFRIPIGGSVPTGAIGYVSAFLEILKDEERLGVSFDHIMHATGSGGTQAGLVAGKALTGWQGRIIGISVSAGREEMEELIYELASNTAALLGGRVDRGSVQVDDRFIGPGYGVSTPEGEEAIRIFARQEGVFLDRVYTGKAASGLLAGIREGEITGKNILFLHTGGQPELFAE
jgi:D-cysteine desulfhydrase family pyridoxal phosphate-dependent enzyme